MTSCEFKRANGQDFEDVDDEDFLKKSFTTVDQNADKNLDLLMECSKLQERTLESTQRALKQLQESEDIGITTAGELIHQKEQLQRANHQLDYIGDSLKFSQKQIQGVKGVFSSLKNFFRSKSQLPMRENYEEKANNDSTSHLVDLLAKEDKQGLHPSLELTGKYIDDILGDSGKKKAVSQEELINNNIEDVLESVKKLKVLAIGLGTEIDEQNELLDDMAEKSELVDITLSKQNKEIKRILK